MQQTNEDHVQNTYLWYKLSKLKKKCFKMFENKIQLKWRLNIKEIEVILIDKLFLLKLLVCIKRVLHPHFLFLSNKCVT